MVTAMTQTSVTHQRTPAFVRFAEACEVLGMSTEGGYKALARGDFPLDAVKIGNLWKVRRADLDALVAGTADD